MSELCQVPRTMTVPWKHLHSVLWDAYTASVMDAAALLVRKAESGLLLTG